MDEHCISISAKYVAVTLERTFRIHCNNCVAHLKCDFMLLMNSINEIPLELKQKAMSYVIGSNIDQCQITH